MPDIVARVRHVCSALLFLAALLGGGSAFAEDSYLLALSWQPAFCASGNHASLPECKLAATAAPRLVLHGLWPDWDVNADGARNAADDFCLAGANNRNAMLTLDRQGNWLKLPAVKLSPATNGDLEAAMPGTVAGLERHEWWKHGTCSGLGADDYFAIAIALMRETERGALAQLIVARAGSTVQRKELLAAFEQDFGAKTARALGLDCDRSGAALNEIRIRLKRATIAQGLTAATLAIPSKAPRSDCAAEIQIPN